MVCVFVRTAGQRQHGGRPGHRGDAGGSVQEGETLSSVLLETLSRTLLLLLHGGDRPHESKTRSGPVERHLGGLVLLILSQTSST